MKAPESGAIPGIDVNEKFAEIVAGFNTETNGTDKLGVPFAEAWQPVAPELGGTCLNTTLSWNEEGFPEPTSEPASEPTSEPASEPHPPVTPPPTDPPPSR